MVDNFGRWTEEKDYDVYPKEKWCMYDYMADAIRKTNYAIKTTMENLITIIFLHAESSAEYGEEIDMEDVHSIMEWVDECGGLQEFDYEC
jgi:hypothetical protein